MRLSEDVKDIIFDYVHHLEFLPTLKMIKHTYRCQHAFADRECDAFRSLLHEDFGYDHIPEVIVDEVYEKTMYDWYKGSLLRPTPLSKDWVPSHYRAYDRLWSILDLLPLATN